MKRRVFFSGCKNLVLAAAMASAGTLAVAQSAFPSRAIKLIVPTNPGGSIDSIARILGEELTKELKQPIVVENRTGAGGAIAATAVAQSAPDGYTLLITHTGVLQGDLLRQNSSYRLADLAPVAEISNSPVAFGVGVNVPATDLKSFVALAKAQPGKLSFGSYGKGTSSHVWAEQFSQAAGITMVHVPYAGEIPALQDVLAGHVASGWGAIGTYKQQVEANKIRILAIANPVRSVLMPDVPTFIEEGFTEMNASGFTGIFAPVGTPRDIVERLSEVIVKVVKRQDVGARILMTGQEPTGVTREGFSKRVANDRQTWAKAITDFKITID